VTVCSWEVLTGCFSNVVPRAENFSWKAASINLSFMTVAAVRIANKRRCKKPKNVPAPPRDCCDDGFVANDFILRDCCRSDINQRRVLVFEEVRKVADGDTVVITSGG